ncbi:MAG: hypothetical protein ACOC0J_00520, partial [Myxococcota bacterium]
MDSNEQLDRRALRRRSPFSMLSACTLGIASAAALAMILATAGCSEPLPPGSCNTSADCPVAGHACMNGKCQEVTAICSGDGDCGYGERCVEGSCVPDENVCLRDADCEEGYRCETLTGRCIRESCVRDEDCEGDYICEDGSCVPPEQNSCLSDTECDPPSTICEGGSCVSGCQSAGCPSGSSCNASTGRCEADSSCSVDADCSPPSTVCEEGSCVEGCEAGSCPLESYCDIRTGRCTPGCTSDANCGAPDRICQGGECEDGCGTTGCETGFTCDSLTGRCLPDEGCSSDADCDPPSLICEGTDCVAGCLSTGCGYEEHCDEATGRCAAGCVLDSDCNPPDTICSEGSCLAPEDCLADGCPSGELCDFDSRLCEPSGTAAIGQACNDGSGGADHTLCATDYCVPLNAPPDGPGPTCSAPCTSMDDCPTGFGCLGLNPSGASVCLAWSPTGPPGASCSDHNECRSALCHEGTCQRTCQHDRECYGEQVCAAVMGTDYMATACRDPGGAGNTGSSCST